MLTGTARCCPRPLESSIQRIAGHLGCEDGACRPARPTGTVTTAVVSRGSAWRYLDNGSNQGTAWQLPVQRHRLEDGQRAARLRRRR